MRSRPNAFSRRQGTSAGSQRCSTAIAGEASEAWSAVSPKLDPLAPPDFDFYEAAGARPAGTINAAGQLTIADTGVLHRDAYLFAAPDLRNGGISLTEEATEPSPGGGPPGMLRFTIETKPTTVGQEFWGFILALE